MTTEGDNAGSKWGVKKMKGEDSLRTVDCLRGRLLAERLASRNAKDEAEQLGNKLMELEKMVKQEAKSRNRAEKKLKSLFKKLESMNISYDNNVSGLEGKTDISSLSYSTTTSSLGTQESKQNAPKSEQGSEINLHQENDSQNYFLFCEGADANSEKSSHLGSQMNYDGDDSKMDEQSDICYHSFRFSIEDGINYKEDDRDDIIVSRIDDSMALVAVDLPRKDRTVDPEVLDSTVKEVLDALRHAKEQLQSSLIESTYMIRVV